MTFHVCTFHAFLMVHKVPCWNFFIGGDYKWLECMCLIDLPVLCLQWTDTTFIYQRDASHVDTRAAAEEYDWENTTPLLPASSRLIPITLARTIHCELSIWSHIARHRLMMNNNSQAWWLQQDYTSGSALSPPTWHYESFELVIKQKMVNFSSKKI